jgi:hypothetical protein
MMEVAGSDYRDMQALRRGHMATNSPILYDHDRIIVKSLRT